MVQFRACSAESTWCLSKRSLNSLLTRTERIPGNTTLLSHQGSNIFPDRDAKMFAWTRSSEGHSCSRASVGPAPILMALRRGVHFGLVCSPK